MNESGMNEEEQEQTGTPEDSAELSPAAKEDAPEDARAPQQKNVALPGALLAERRQALGLTLEQVAEQLKMTPRRISEIEADNVEVVQSKAVFRGFVRAYAKVLGMDPEPLVSMLADESMPSISLKPVRRKTPETFTATQVSFTSKYNMQTKRMGVAIIVVVLLIGGLLAQRILSSSSSKKSEAIQQSSAPASATVAVTPPAVKTVGASATAASASASTSASASAPAVPKAEQKVKRIALPSVDVSKQLGVAAKEEKKTATSETVKKAATSEPVKPAQAKPAPSGNAALVLKCNEESWIELKRNSGELVASRYIAAGKTVRFSVDEPMQLTIGNAPAVEATLRGRRLNIQVAGDSKVVRLNIK